MIKRFRDNFSLLNIFHDNNKINDTEYYVILKKYNIKNQELEEIEYIGDLLSNFKEATIFFTYSSMANLNIFLTLVSALLECLFDYNAFLKFQTKIF